MNWGFERGALPRCSSTSLWAISSATVVAKSFGPNKLQCIAYPWVEMWRLCEYNGKISTSIGTVEIDKGCVHSVLALHALGVDEADGVLEVLQKVKVDMFQVPLPTLALALERVGDLKKIAHMQRVARCLAKTFLGILDKFILERSVSILKEELSIGPRYEYRCGKRRKHQDPRLQVGHISISNQHMSLTALWGSCDLTSPQWFSRQTWA